MYDLIFRGSLAQYWRAIHKEWQKPLRKNPLAAEPFRLSHHHAPQGFEEVTIEFLDDQRRLGLVTVDALSGSDGKFVKLIVHDDRDAYEQVGKTALAGWKKIENTWLRRGWLTNPLAQTQQAVAKPRKPAKPKPGSKLNLWFDYYHAMQAAGFKYTFGDIASETSYNPGHIANLHGNYKKEHGLK